MNHLPITDADRAAWQAQKSGQPAGFSALLQETMTATGATSAPEQPVDEIRPQLPIATYRQLGAALVFIAVALLVAWIAFRPGPPTTDHRRPTTDPAGVAAQPPSAAPVATAQPAQVEAYAAPEGVALGPIDANAPIVYRHSEYPEWGGVEWNDAIVWIEADHAPPTSLPDLARPTPAPTVERIYIPVEPPCDVATNPRYVKLIEVTRDGIPLGEVTGRSCDSQAAAEADAETQAAEMRVSAPTPCPTWAGPPFVKPDCGGN